MINTVSNKLNSIYKMSDYDNFNGETRSLYEASRRQPDTRQKYLYPQRTDAVAISEITTATPSASVVLTIDNGVATLSGSVPEESTRDSLIDAASELKNVSSVHDALFVSEPPPRRSFTGFRIFKQATG